MPARSHASSAGSRSETLRNRAAQDGRMVSRQPRLVGAHPQRRLSRRAPRGSLRDPACSAATASSASELARAGARAATAAVALVARASRHRRSGGGRDAIAPPRPTLVVNAAAYTKVDRAENETEAARAGNATAPAVLAAACAAAGVPLIHISTDYVFDGTQAGRLRRGRPVAPLGVYGRSKAAGEAAVRERSRST